MNRTGEIKSGWDFMDKILGGEIAAHIAFEDYLSNINKNKIISVKNEHIQQINEAINQLNNNINKHPHINLDVEQFKGYVAEEMHAGTFNIEAIRQGSVHRACTLQENGYGTVDIETNFGKSYGLKYSNTAKDAENMQAVLNLETRSGKYEGQERLIAYEQLDEAKFWARKRASRNMESRPDVANSHIETEQHLVGTISDGEGIESKKLSVKEAKKIAREAKEGRFDAESYGYKKDNLLKSVRIDYINRAMKAGLTAAAITAITKLVPELYKAIDYLIKNRQIDLSGVQMSGKNIFTASGEAFLRGSIAYCVEMAIQEGLLGNTIKQVNPSIVGVAVMVVLGTIKDSILVAIGKMTTKEMGANFVDTLVVSSGYLLGIKIGSILVQALCPQLPGISYAIGSLLGCSIAVVYSMSKKKFISFCVDTGITCFGLVDQDYKLPDEALKALGVHSIPIPKTEIHQIKVERVVTDVLIDRLEYETIDITILSRGIIGINRVGYIV